jgi:delta-1-pyrroline-5-carboxylate synthetase
MASAVLRYRDPPISITTLSNLTYSTQVLLTGYDFLAPEGPQNFLQTLDCLLGMKMVPILNGNDVHSPPPQRNSDLQDVVSIPDNDYLSSLVATSTHADLLILLSDVDGLYTGHPSDSKSRLIRTYYPEHPMQVSFWGKSRVGLGGMENKLNSAVKVVEGGTPVVIANGTKGEETILDIVRGRPVGTLVASNGYSELTVSAEQLADEG